MQNTLFSESDLVVFSSPRPFYYGNRITIVEDLGRQGGLRAVRALLSSGEQEELFLDAEGEYEQRLIVLRSWKENNKGFSNHAVSVERLEEVAQEIEDSVARLLRPSSNNRGEETEQMEPA